MGVTHSEGAEPPTKRVEAGFSILSGFHAGFAGLHSILCRTIDAGGGIVILDALLFGQQLNPKKLLGIALIISC